VYFENTPFVPVWSVAKIYIPIGTDVCDFTTGTVTSDIAKSYITSEAVCDITKSDTTFEGKGDPDNIRGTSEKRKNGLRKMKATSCDGISNTITLPTEVCDPISKRVTSKAVFRGYQKREDFGSPVSGSSIVPQFGDWGE
jgi:hypothetical protein